MSIKMKDKKDMDIRVIFLLLLFIGLPISVFMNWIVTHNEVDILIKMVVIFMSAVLVSLIYWGVRYLFIIRRSKVKINIFSYILLQSVSLIITLIIIGLIVSFL